MQLQNFRSGRGRSNPLEETCKLNGYATVAAVCTKSLCGFYLAGFTCPKMLARSICTDTEPHS
jgi:hypothetical protein